MIKDVKSISIIAIITMSKSATYENIVFKVKRCWRACRQEDQDSISRAIKVLIIFPFFLKYCGGNQVPFWFNAQQKKRGSPEEEASGSLFYVFLSLGVSSDPFGAQWGSNKATSKAWPSHLNGLTTRLDTAWNSKPRGKLTPNGSR